MVKQRINWAWNLTQEQKQRINSRECPNCGKPKSEWNRRTDWTCCSKKCTGEFYENLAVLDWSKVRKQAFKRDDYTCRYCGKRFAFKSQYDGEEYPVSGTLVGDHIIPIACGGEEFDINNVQTLCIDCNKIKTKYDAQRIAKFRRREKELKYDIEIIKVSYPIQKELKLCHPLTS